MALDPTFGKFYLISNQSFTSGELVSLVKVFRLERFFFWVFKVWTQVGRCTTSDLLGRASVFVMPSCLFSKKIAKWRY